jgi:hypothetical protein
MLDVNAARFEPGWQNASQSEQNARAPQSSDKIDYSVSSFVEFVSSIRTGRTEALFSRLDFDSAFGKSHSNGAFRFNFQIYNGIRPKDSV